jgi:hypothetical protein
MSRTALHWATEAERQRIQDIIAKHDADRPHGVRSIQFASFGEDQGGNPAAYLMMIVGKEMLPTKGKIEELTDYAQIIVNDILDRDPDYFPYIRTVIEE